MIPMAEEKAVKPFDTMLLTTDFSELSTAAVESARALAEKFKATLILFYVLDDRIPPYLEEYVSHESQETQRQRAREDLKKFASTHLGKTVSCETVVRFGIPDLEIIRFAEEREADLIVMATHGRGSLGHLLVGSTTERVLRQAPCPVLAVRAKKK